MKYQDYLQTSHWKSLRKECFQRCGKTCCICGSKEAIQAHHLIYKASWFDTLSSDLVPLCRTHHALVHDPKEGKLWKDVLFENMRKMHTWMQKSKKHRFLPNPQSRPVKSKPKQAKRKKKEKPKPAPARVAPVILRSPVLESPPQSKRLQYIDVDPALPPIDSFRNCGRFFTRSTAEMFGITWPAPKGWVRAIRRAQRANLQRPQLSETMLVS